MSTKPTYTYMKEEEMPEELKAKIQALPPAVLESIKDRLDTIPVEILEKLASREGLSRRSMVRWKIPFNRHQMREIAVEAIYQHLLLHKDIRLLLRDILFGTNEIDGYLYALTIGTQENEEKYARQIDGMLRKDWDFDRLSLLEQAILLMSFQEIEENQTPKPVVINEAVTLAKKYCDDQSYKLINGVLDQL